MPKLRVHGFSISLDGYGAGPRQDLENPMGVGAGGLHAWFRATSPFLEMIGKGGKGTGPDEEFAQRGIAGLGAWILGRNMFGPVRGEWPDGEWKGWWGPNPPYHCPVFVLTHHKREPLAMEGGTVFHFVTGGIHEALRLAKEAAGDKDIRLGGGVSTLRQFLQAKLVDEMHLAISPVLLGSGENLWAGLDLPALGYKVAETVQSPNATHVVFKRS